MGEVGGAGMMEEGDNEVVSVRGWFLCRHRRVVAWWRLVLAAVAGRLKGVGVDCIEEFEFLFSYVISLWG